MSGRPLRFLGTIALLWTGWRVVALWPLGEAPARPDLPHVVLPAIGIAQPATAATLPEMPTRQTPAGLSRHLASASTPIRAGPIMRVPAPGLPTALPGPLSGVGAAPSAGQSVPPPGYPTRAVANSQDDRPDRWSGSAWLVLRGGGGRPTGIAGGQLGGSQAGVRLAYTIDRPHRIAIVGRATTPMHGVGREMSMGIEWQPTRLPLRLVAEQRVAVDRGHGGPAIGAIGGIGPTPIAAGFDLESYAQAGVIRRTRREPFVDGAVRIARPVAMLDDTRIDLGLGMSGGAQRDAARLDIGPSIGTRLPFGDRRARLTLDWRQRIAGDARPGSGLALTLGGDF